MAIEYVDPREIENDPEPGETAAHRVESVCDGGRLANVESKIRESLLDLERQVERLAGVNTGLFGSDRADPGAATGSTIGEDAGLVISLETRAAELRRLVARLEQAVEETASLT